ncbi:IS110 family transposase [Chromobacterium violaceum]|uniref:IS110 family transposase n=1 Tax=Chromobacterium violaceum TaxID=536 RepID=UPI001B341277|nr:IS110 family transposase [Chromobacterium violaceum]MBP4047286.1 IS110 family transposase [Chromobacterium violaceum]
MADPIHDVRPQTWVAIDIAKQFHAVLIETSQGRLQRFKMASTAYEHDRLIALLSSLPQPCQIALEPTGNFHRTLAWRLLAAGFDVVTVSTVAAARYREARFNSWDKNDPKDAQVILEMLKQGLTQFYHEPLLTGCHDLQELSKTYHQVAMARKRLADTLLNHYLPLYFPEMARYWEATRAEWFIAFLQRFPTPGIIMALNESEFVQAAGPLLGRKVNKTGKLLEMYALAQHSSALPVQEDSLAVQTFRQQLAHMAHVATLRRTLEQQAQALLQERWEFRCLSSLPGVATILALIILAEVGDIRRFGHHRQFLKYCGLDLAKSQSGQSKGKERLSKRGNARLRYAFWMAALVAVRMTENSFRDKYERYLASAPDDADRKRMALTAVAAKMARVAYGLLKTRTLYQGYFEHALPGGSTSLALAVEATMTS